MQKFTRLKAFLMSLGMIFTLSTIIAPNLYFYAGNDDTNSANTNPYSNEDLAISSIFVKSVWSYDTSSRARNVAISSNGQYVAVASYDFNLYFFESNNSTPLWISNLGESVQSVSISSDGQYIVAGTTRDTNKVYLFEKNSSIPLWSYYTGGIVTSLAMSSDGQYFVAGVGRDNYSIYLFERNSSTPLWRKDTGYAIGHVASVAIASDGNYIVTGSHNRKLYFFEKNSSTPIWTYTTPDWAQTVAISSDGNYIVVGTADGDNPLHGIFLFEKNNSTPLWNYTTGHPIWSVAISSDGNYIAFGTAHTGNKLYFFERHNSTPLWSFNAGDSVTSVAISSDGKYIVAGSQDHNIYFFDRISSIPLFSYDTGSDIESVAISSDGTYFVAGNLREYVGIDNVYLFQVAAENREIGPIEIDDNDPLKNWSIIASTYDWCNGSGTWKDPYIIENVTIDGLNNHNCIRIDNSNVYFMIRNCTLINGVGEYWHSGGIRLENVTNGKLINNNCSFNQQGIYLVRSNNLTISGNIANNNTIHGIVLYDQCNDTKIIGNTACFNSHCGIKIEEKYTYYNGYNNLVINNNASYNVAAGISLVFINNTEIFNNTAINNGVYPNVGVGISVQASRNITISFNHVQGNGYSIDVYNTKDCKIINNFAISKKECGIRIERSINFNVSNNNVSYSNIGIMLRGSSSLPQHTYNNTVLGNLVYDNYYGMYLLYTDNNTILRNNAIENVIGIYLRRSNYNNVSGNTLIGNDECIIELDCEGNIFENNYCITGYVPKITIISPKANELFSQVAPAFEVLITDPNLHKMWYSIDEGLTNTTFTDNVSISQELWDDASEGIVILTFYANDTAGHINSTSVSVLKDTTNPTITILSPIDNDVYGLTPPSFELLIDDANLDSTWYIIEGIQEIFYFSGFNGTIDETLWDMIEEGIIEITFFANDSAGNLASESVNIIKTLPSEEFPLTILIIAIVSAAGGIGVAIITVGILRKRKLTKEVI